MFDHNFSSVDNMLEMNSTNLTLDVEKLASEQAIFKFGSGIHYYYLPVCVFFGLIGNTMSFVVMIQPHNRRISCCLYLAVLAVCDNSALLIFGYYWTKATFQIESENQQLQCSVLAWLNYAVTQYGILLIVAMTVDRLVIVKYPLKAPQLCSHFRTKLIIIVLLVVCLVFTLPHLFITTVSGKYLCFSFQGSGVWIKVYAFVVIIFNAFVVFIALLTMNILIIKTLRNNLFRDSKKINRRLEQSKEGRDRLAQTQLTIMLLLVSFAFLVLTTPNYIRHITYTYKDYKSDPDTYAVYVLIYHISSKLYVTNSAVNIILYCIGGAKFRKDFKYFFCCQKRPTDYMSHRAPGLSPTSNSGIPR